MCSDSDNCIFKFKMAFQIHFTLMNRNFDSKGIKEYIGFNLFTKDSYLNAITDYLDTYSIFKF